jgi:O-antigen/teichoic acid export membrane protein
VSHDAHAASTSSTLRKLKKRAVSLGAAKAFEYGTHFLMPIVLVRCLDTATFGEYRLLWLAMGTVAAVVNVGIPQGLFYFLPRSDATARRLYIHQTMLFLLTTGLIAAWAVSPLNPWLPSAIAPLAKYGPLVPVFVVLWVTGGLLDTLPLVEERIALEVRLVVAIATLRVLLLTAGAFLTGDLAVMIGLLIALAFLKLLLLFGYVTRRHGLQGPWFDWRAFVDQFRHSAPLGVSSSLFGLRLQADQWVAASLFALSSFAAFSVAAVLAPLVTLCRASVTDAFLPSMSRLQAAGDVRGMVDLNGRANATVALVLLPALAFAFAFANEIVTIIYTPNYLEAAPVMRVYICGLTVGVLEIHSLLLLLRQGPFALRVNFAALAISVSLSLFAAHHFGLAGAAAGSVTAIYFDRVLMFRRIASLTGIPVRRLQNWRALAMTLLLAIASAVLARSVVLHYLPASGPALKLLVGGGALATTFLSLHILLGLGRGWLAAAQRAEHNL